MPLPKGLDADLAETAAMVSADEYPVFHRAVFLGASYTTMPFSSCWCRPVPTDRHLMRHRWHHLVDTLVPTGELPALTEATRGLPSATETWLTEPLPLYPPFRN